MIFKEALKSAAECGNFRTLFIWRVLEGYFSNVRNKT